MRRFLACIAASAALAACGPKVEKKADIAGEAAVSSPQTQTAGNAAAVPAAGFKVEPLSEGEGDVQGCQTMLSLQGGNGDIFRASAADNDAPGFVKIDGSVIRVDLTSAAGDEKSHARTFESADRKTSVIETLTTGAAHPDSDSVEQSGSLEITHNGEKRTFPVEGGTAC